MKKIFLLLIIIASPLLKLYAQMDLDGEFRFRWYSDRFYDTRDNRDKENYIRYFGRLHGSIQSSKTTTFHTEVSTVIQNPNTVSARNIAGSGRLNFTVSQLYADIVMPDIPVLDLMRLRLGRQPFGLGSGLSFGESYYYLEKFDGARVDLAYGDLTLTGFGAITGQNLSESGLYPEPGSDQVYALRAGYSVYQQDIIAYYLLNKYRGMYNDNYIIGAGLNSEMLQNRLNYFAEFAYQKFNTAPGLPEKGGIGYMGGIGYRWTIGPIRSLKVETRYAAFRGDDKSTKDIEIFSPPYASFFWGDRFGYVNGEIGGNFPNNGRYPDGSRLWFTRVYMIHKSLPALRVQLQYLKMNEYEDTDGINPFDDEVSLRFYYQLYKQAQLQLRISKSFVNGEDTDANNSGQITSSEDRYSYMRFMFEVNLEF